MWGRNKKTIDPTSRFKVLEELIEKCETPEQIHLLMEMNVDRTAGLLQEIYELRGELAGYRKINKDFIERFWEKYDYYTDIKE